MRYVAAAAAISAALLAAWNAAKAQSPTQLQVDTALVVAVDVSNSVDEERYHLQMEGIANALEDPGVIDAITNGPNGGILFAMVTWADRPDFTLPWQKISSKQEAYAVASRIRKLPHQGGEFTCMTRMMRSVNDKVVSQIPPKRCAWCSTSRAMVRITVTPKSQSKRFATSWFRMGLLSTVFRSTSAILPNP